VLARLIAFAINQHARMESAEQHDAEFEEMVRQARWDLENPPPDGCFLGSLGCLGGTVLGCLFCLAMLRVLLLFDRAYGHPFDLERPYGVDLSILVYSVGIGIAATVLTPKLARSLRKLRKRQRSWGAKERAQFRMKAAAIGVVFVLLCGAGLGAIFRARRDKLNSVYAAVAKGELKPNSKGVVDLPPQYDGLSGDDNAYVTRRGQLLMVFLPDEVSPLDVGKTFPLEGRLMCSRPLLAKDLRGGWDGKGIKIKTPGNGACQGGSVKVERKIAGNHYSASCTFVNDYFRD
jgi:hypothetical protein